MSEELEHIDSIFSEKLKNHREKPSESAWDKLAMGLDEKDQKQEKLNRNNKGKLGLLSITIISFMFIFSGHNIKTNSSTQSEDHSPKIEKNISSKVPLRQKPKIIEKEIDEEKPKDRQDLAEKNKTIISSNAVNTYQEETPEALEVIEKKEKKSLQISSIDIEKKPPVSIQPQERETKKRRKGIKIEITLDTTQVNKRAAAPQTKKTFNTIFRKLRKFTEASKKN